MAENGEINISLREDDDNMLEPARPSAEEMDEIRHNQVAYEYLCRLEEAKEWIQTCLKMELPHAIELEESLRNGVILARLANYIDPESTPIRKIYDLDESHYHEAGLHYRHTDNVNYFLNTMRVIALPQIFYPDCVDVYDKKNMPKVVYCLHALSYYLQKRFGNKFPRLRDLTSVAKFTDEEISNMAKELAKYGLTLPAFGKIGGLLTDDLTVDEAALHAAIIAINEMIDKSDPSSTVFALQNPNAYLVNVNDQNANQYQANLQVAKQNKVGRTNSMKNGQSSEDESTSDVYNYLLTRSEIQGIINSSNSECMLYAIYLALRTNDEATLRRLLQDGIPGLALRPDLIPYYFKLLKEAQDKLENENDVLTLDAIASIIRRANEDLARTADHAKLAVRINHLLCVGANTEITYDALTLFAEAENVECMDDLRDPYMRNLSAALVAKNRNDEPEPEWIFAKTTSGYTVFVNTRTYEIRLEIATEETHLWYLTIEEITTIVQETNINKREQADTKLVNEAASKIQTAWRAHHERQQSSMTYSYYKQRERDVIKAQSYARMYVQRKKFLQRLQLFKEQQNAANRIQRYYRNWKTKQAYQDLMNATVSSLKDTDLDYDEELQIDSLRNDIVDLVRQHKQYEGDLDSLDLKIGLLVRNCITVEEVLAHKRRIKISDEKNRLSVNRLSNGPSGTDDKSAMDLFSKENRHRIQAYQHLLFFLTRNPKYLAKLILLIPSTEFSEFIIAILLPLFNNGSREHSEYLLMRLIREILELEINHLQSVEQFGSEKLKSVQLILILTKNMHGDQYLRQLLRPLVPKLLAEEQDVCDVNPVAVLEKCVHENTSNSPVTSPKAPREVSPTEAMVHPQVTKTLSATIETLKRWALEFLNPIVASTDNIPYVIRYFCKAMEEKLLAKFGEPRRKDILKAIGSVIYARFIDDAILNPGTYGIITASESSNLALREKNKLTVISRVLTCAAANRGFNQDNPHLIVLNSTIREYHEKFKTFFQTVCEVPNLENHYSVDEFTDYVTVAKSKVIIRLGALIHLHQLLVDNREVLAPDANNVLRELLDAFGEERPSVEEVIGDCDPQMRDRAGSIEIVLILTNKFEARVSGGSAVDRLFFKTKKFLVDVMLCQSASSLTKLLQLPVTPEDETKHRQLAKNEHGFVSPEELTLAEKKAIVLRNLRDLEQMGAVSAENDYAEIISSVAQDVKNRQRYRGNRVNEKIRLQNTLEQLNRKTDYYKEQLSHYDKYLQSCLVPGKGNKSASSAPTIRSSIKYSAAKLRDKGVLLSISDVPENAYKNVYFEVKRVDNPGTFNLNTRFPSEKVVQTENLNFQSLLKMQFDNVPTVLFFGRATFSTNLLVLLLNKKFYMKQ